MKASAAAARCAVGVAFSLVSAAAAEAPRRDTPSGFPVPRFLSVRSDVTNCRTGPSFQHPVAITYVQEGTPVLVIAETVDHWRKVRDVDRAECWVHESTLKARTHVILLADAAARARPSADAAVTARLAKGSLAGYDGETGTWTRIAVGKTRGFVESAEVWGVDADAAARKSDVRP